MISILDSYQTLVFDCDGVVLDSNKVKTQAFYQAALPYGEPAAQALVQYHVAHGGVSRYKKFAHFLDVLVPEHSNMSNGPDLNALLAAYATAVQEGLLQCQIAPGLAELRAATPNARWLIVSGGDQAELRRVFSSRGIADFFDGGIFGSPDSKDVILARELERNNISQPGLFLGDSKYDFEVARSASLDFIFLSGWSDFVDHDKWLLANGIKKISHLINIFEFESYD